MFEKQPENLGGLNHGKDNTLKRIVKFFYNFASNYTILMLQRIQTVYLALAAIAGLLVFFFPLGIFYDQLQGNYKFFVCAVQSMDPEPAIYFARWITLPLILLMLVSLIFSVTTIFLYKKRSVQLRLVAFNVLVNIVFIVLVFFYYVTKIKTLTHIEPSYGIGIVFPLAALVFLIMANRSIRKDEALVRSTERLR